MIPDAVVYYTVAALEVIGLSWSLTFKKPPWPSVRRVRSWCILLVHKLLQWLVAYSKQASGMCSLLLSSFSKPFASDEMTATKAGTVPLAVVMPAFNEAAVIVSVVSGVLALPGVHLILVDDASVDGTAALARDAGATVVPMCIQVGAWSATQAGIRYARRLGYTRVVTMDADGQHLPDYIQTLIEPIERGVANTVIGACPRRGSLSRQIAWALMRLTSGVRIEDLTSGFRAYDEKSMAVLASWRATFLDYQDVGVLTLLLSQDLAVTDVEVTMLPRGNGGSRIFRSWRAVLYYMCHTLLLGLSKRRIPHYRGPKLHSVS